MWIYIYIYTHVHAHKHACRYADISYLYQSLHCSLPFKNVFEIIHYKYIKSFLALFNNCTISHSLNVSSFNQPPFLVYICFQYVATPNNDARYDCPYFISLYVRAAIRKTPRGWVSGSKGKRIFNLTNSAKPPSADFPKTLRHCPSFFSFLSSSTLGELKLSKIQKNVKQHIRDNISLFSLGIGFDVDYDFLKRLSNENRGIAQRIYGNQDTSSQLKVTLFFCSFFFLHSKSFNQQYLMPKRRRPDLSHNCHPFCCIRPREWESLRFLSHLFLHVHLQWQWGGRWQRDGHTLSLSHALSKTSQALSNLLGFPVPLTRLVVLTVMAIVPPLKCIGVLVSTFYNATQIKW